MKPTIAIAPITTAVIRVGLGIECNECNQYNEYNPRHWSPSQQLVYYTVWVSLTSKGLQLDWKLSFDQAHPATYKLPQNVEARSVSFSSHHGFLNSLYTNSGASGITTLSYFSISIKYMKRNPLHDITVQTYTANVSIIFFIKMLYLFANLANL